MLSECFGKIVDKDEKDFLANLQMPFVFLFLSTVSDGGLEYEYHCYYDENKKDEDKSVNYFRYIAHEAIRSLLTIIMYKGDIYSKSVFTEVLRTAGEI